MILGKVLGMDELNEGYVEEDDRTFETWDPLAAVDSFDELVPDPLVVVGKRGSGIAGPDHPVLDRLRGGILSGHGQTRRASPAYFSINRLA